MYSVIATDGRRLGLIRECLRSLSECVIPDCYKGLILVENSTNHCLKSLAEDRFPFPIRYCSINEFNKSAALNFVLDEYPNDFLYFHDDDMTFTANTLVAMAKAVEQHPDKAFFAGPLSIKYDTAPPDWLRRYLPRSVIGWKHDLRGVTKTDDLPFLGGNWAAMSADLRAIGGFEIALGPSCDATGEDTVAQLKLKDLGCDLYYVPEAESCHYVPVERCSPEWTIQRKYRNGKLDGLRTNSGNISIKYAVSELKVLFLAMRETYFRLVPNETKLFDSRCRKAWHEGVLDGLRSKNKIAI